MDEIQEKEREISPVKSYVVGILRRDATAQQPKFRVQATYHGGELKVNGIKTLRHFIENKRLGLTPRQTYHVYEVEDSGALSFWGQFTAQTPVPPKPKKGDIAGLGAVDATTTADTQALPSIAYSLPNGMGVNTTPQEMPPSRSWTAMKESFEKMLADKQAQMDYNNSIRDREIMNLREQHRAEIERIIDTKNSEIMTLENQNAKFEEKYDHLLSEYYQLQNANAELTSKLAVRDGELQAQQSDHNKRMKILEAEYKTREELYGRELNLKHQAQAGLSDGNSMAGILDILKVLSPYIAPLFMGNAGGGGSAPQGTPQPVTVQGASASAQAPPPPRPISRPPLPQVTSMSSEETQSA